MKKEIPFWFGVGILVVAAVLAFAIISNVQNEQLVNAKMTSSATTPSSQNAGHTEPITSTGTSGTSPFSFTITSPNSQTQWIISTTHPITWTPPQGVAEVAIELENNVSTANCQTSLCIDDSGYKSYLLTTQGSSAKNTGSFLWQVGTGYDLQNDTQAHIPPGEYSVTIEELDAAGNSIPGGVVAKSGWFGIVAQ
jgi:hypothetical protein